MSSVNNSQKKDVDQIEGPWSPEEDEMLLNFFRKHGPHYWSLISMSIPSRSGKSCRLRWLSLQRSFTPEEDEMLENLIEKHGPNWSLIGMSIPGKSAVACELRWETIWSPYQSYIDNPTMKWKSSSMTNEDLNNGDHTIYIRPPPSFSDISRGGESSNIHDGNSSHEVGGVSKSVPSISYMARTNMSSGGTHPYSREKSAPSIGYMARGNMSSGGIHSFSRDKTAPSWNALNKLDLSLMIESDNVKEFQSDEFKPMMIKSDNVQEISSDEFHWNILFGEDGDN